jgi:hypothetical protein
MNTPLASNTYSAGANFFNIPLSPWRSESEAVPHTFLTGCSQNQKQHRAYNYCETSLENPSGRFDPTISTQWLLVIVSFCSTHTGGVGGGGGERGIILILILAADIIISVLVCERGRERGFM